MTVDWFASVRTVQQYFLYSMNQKYLIFPYTRYITRKRVTHSVSASLRRTTLLIYEEMSQRWRVVGTTVFDLTCPRFDPPAPKKNVLPLDKLAGTTHIKNCKIYLSMNTQNNKLICFAVHNHPHCVHTKNGKRMGFAQVNKKESSCFNTVVMI